MNSVLLFCLGKMSLYSLCDELGTKKETIESVMWFIEC